MSDKVLVKRMIVYGIVIVFLLMVVFFIAFFQLENVEVISEGEYYSDSEIKDRVLNHVTDSFTYLFALRAETSGLDEIPFVEKVDYEVVDKNSIRIYVYERQIAGSVLVMGKYFCFDREGVVTDSTDTRPEGVVLVTGIDVGNIVIGQKIDSSSDIFKGLMGLVSLLNKNNIDASEISYDFRGNVTLFIGDDEVLLGEKDNYDLEINNLSSIMKTMGEGAFRFDLRYMDSENMSVTAKPIDK
ncbi:MAG: hypothetical protein IJL07_04570 [Lachnospiraceae bacterium]|nr:hypothetical protein [Lachnospiraceae bacterium]MBQ6090522.1 hypothetical protein [Lachnospiraceae bacterium]